MARRRIKANQFKFKFEITLARARERHLDRIHEAVWKVQINIKKVLIFLQFF